MTVQQKKIFDMLAAAKDGVVPPRQNFDAAWSAIPAYREHMKHDVMARSSYTIDEMILQFLKNRLIDIRDLMLVCERALENAIRADK
jgi:hypothetical protein